VDRSDFDSDQFFDGISRTIEVGCRLVGQQFSPERRYVSARYKLVGSQLVDVAAE
jgi:hypothetical protein